MNCAEVDELLGAWHDRELDPARSRELEAHLSGCAQCAAARERLEALSSVVKEHATYYTAPAGLRARLESKLAPKQPWYGRWPVLAAACLALALVVWRVAPAPGDSAIESEVVAAHLRSLMADHLMDVPSTDQHTVKPWFTGKLDFAPRVEDLSAQGFELVGGRLDYLDGRPVAALIYRRRKHTINVFTWPAGPGRQELRQDTRQGFHVVHWVSQGMQWWAVSDVSADDLRTLAGLL
jgi:anti-sigma factor RsiW